MKIKALKNLIVFGAFAFAFLCYGHALAYVPGVWDYQPNIQTGEPAFTQVPMGADYYSYYPAPAPIASTNNNANNQTATPKNTATKPADNSTANTDKTNGNNLTALSLNGSGSFMPSSI